MELQPVDKSTLLVLMIAGGIMAAVGLYMILKPKPENAAKIELFGLKFESSSAGLLVFVVGAAFLAMPLFVPERRAEAVRVPQAPISPVAPDNERAGLVIPDAVDEPKDGTVREETEPNNTFGEAERLRPGESLRGSINYGSTDWIEIDISEDQGPFELRVRRNNTQGKIGVMIFDMREQQLASFEVSQSSRFFSLDPASGQKFYAQVSQSSPFVSAYEVTVLRTAEK